MSTAKKGMKKSTYLIIWTLVIALLCSAVGVVNYEALYWDSALTLYFGEVGVKNVSTVTFDTDDHAQVANLIVAEGAVLLKNEKNALPMKSSSLASTTRAAFCRRCWRTKASRSTPRYLPSMPRPAILPARAACRQATAPKPAAG